MALGVLDAQGGHVPDRLGNYVAAESLQLIAALMAGMFDPSVTRPVPVSAQQDADAQHDQG